MFSANGTYYTEEHSISFGDLVTKTVEGKTVTVFNPIANTWTDWHLIPSSRPSVAHPGFATKYVEIPGMHGNLDLTEYLTGGPVFGPRSGSFSFIVDNNHEYWEIIRQKMVTALHGKRMKMQLQDDPSYYYEGRFTVGNWESGPSYSSISISYQLDPFKRRIAEDSQITPLWDPFNFDGDYDYSGVVSNIQVNGPRTLSITTPDYLFDPRAVWISGTVVVTFGGVTQTLNSAGSKKLGEVGPGTHVMSLSGSGSIKMVWKGGSL